MLENWSVETYSLYQILSKHSPFVKATGLNQKSCLTSEFGILSSCWSTKNVNHPFGQPQLYVRHCLWRSLCHLATQRPVWGGADSGWECKKDLRFLVVKIGILCLEKIAVNRGWTLSFPKQIGEQWTVSRWIKDLKPPLKGFTSHKAIKRV